MLGLRGSTPGRLGVGDPRISEVHFRYLKGQIRVLLPKYTIRQLLIATVFAAFVCAILGFAARGNAFAYGLGIAILGLIVPLASYALMYWTLLAVTKAMPGTGLPIGPVTPVSHAHDSTKSPTAKQLGPVPGTSPGNPTSSTIDEHMS